MNDMTRVIGNSMPRVNPFFLVKESRTKAIRLPTFYIFIYEEMACPLLEGFDK